MMAPPHKGPTTAPASALAPMSPKAMARLEGVISTPPLAMAIGINAPPPIAWTTRAPTNAKYCGSISSHFGMSELRGTAIDPRVNIPVRQ